MQQVRAVALTGFLDACRSVGLDGHQLLREMRITPAMLADPENRIRASTAINLVEKAAERSDCDSFGMLMASSRTFASLGPIALLLQHLDTVGDVVAALRDYHRYIADVLIVDVEDYGETSVVKIRLSENAKRHAVDIAMAATCMTLTGASGGRWVPERVYFVRDPPADLALWHRVFGSPMSFRHDFNGFAFPTTALAIDLPLANATLAQHARQLLKLVSLPRMEEPTVEQVRRTILLMLPGGRTTLDSVARNIGLSGRTLQRQLENDGRSFRELLDDVRREIVERNLGGSTQSVSSLAEMTGYNSVSAFSRWFGSQFGMTPTDWRAAQKKEAEGPPPTWRL